MDERRRWFVVTGAASGIGLAVATELSREGCNIVLVDRDAARLSNEISRLPRQSGAIVREVIGDVGDPETANRAAAEVPETDRLAGWVNAAGVNVPGSILDIDEVRLRDGMRTNFESAIWGCRAAVARMVRTGEPGSVVNLTSTAAFVGYPGNAVYAAAKGAIVALTKQIAAEVAERGIRCNAVAPGVIDTPMNSSILERSGDDERDALLEYWHSLSPIGRLGSAAEVAGTVMYLLSEAGAFTTGQTIVVDGGQLAVGRRPR